jgi:hypothetical protein
MFFGDGLGIYAPHLQVNRLRKFCWGRVDPRFARVARDNGFISLSEGDHLSAPSNDSSATEPYFLAL